MKKLSPWFILALISCGSGELSTNNSPVENNENDAAGNNVVADVGNNSSNNTNNTHNTNNGNNLNNTTIDVGMDVGMDVTTGNDMAADMGVDVAPDIEEDLPPAFHPMFIQVADFFLEKCVDCHAENQNGNFWMPQGANPTYEEIRVNIDGVVSTRGRLIIAQNAPQQSEAFLFMTNAAGEQFDAPTIALVENWINAGAPFFENE